MELIEKLDRLKKEVFLINAFEGAVLRLHPKDGSFIKFKGDVEIPAHVGGKILTDSILEFSEITKEEYEKY